MPYAEVNNTRLHYRIDGAEGAPVLVLSNSLGTDMGMWDLQMPAFSERFRVLRYDCRGHGASRVTPGPYSIGLLAADVLGLLDSLGIERVDFCGLSLGGMVGQWLCVHAAERIGRVVLCNTTAWLGPAALWNNRIEAVRDGGMAAIADGVLDRWFTAPFLEQPSAALSQARATLLNTPADGYVACCAAVRDMDQRQDVSAIRQPALVISGSEDQATPPADGRFLAERIVGARYVELSAAHLSNIEEPGRFTGAALDFLCA